MPFFSSAQEFPRWNKADFEIKSIPIEIQRIDHVFLWETDYFFNLPEVNFLSIDSDRKQQVDMLAVIDKTERNKIRRQVDLGSPIPEFQKEKKGVQFSVEPTYRRDNSFNANNLSNNPYFVSPLLYDYYRNNYHTRRNSITISTTPDN